MAKNVVIQTDGTAVTYSGVKEIETNDPEQGRVTWIPMDETELAIKTVNKNGTYKASDDGYYGYRRFIVATNNKGKTVGTKSDGRTYAIDTDNDGWLTETLLPDNIRINPQPTKTTYQNGETISLSGAVVKAYSKDDIWEGDGYSGGVIPHGELTLEPSTASGGGGGGGDATEIDVSELGYISPIISNAVSLNDVTSYYVDPVEVIYQIDGGPVSVYVFDGNGYAYYVSQNPFTLYVHRMNGSYAGVISGRNVNGAYVASRGWMSGRRLVDEKYSASADQAFSDTDAANVLKNGRPMGQVDQTVKVSWNRPEDEETLSTTFGITVSG